jgi:hypothetical protein
LLQTAKQLAKSPSSPINEACGTWASTPGILNPHWEATAQRMAGCDGPVPVITVADRESDFFEYLIGWTKDQRQRNLHLLVNNARFLILPWVHCKNPASRILALISRRPPDDWQHLANMQGRGNLDTPHQDAQPIKSIWIYPLARNFQRQLRSE